MITRLTPFLTDGNGIFHFTRWFKISQNTNDKVWAFLLISSLNLGNEDARNWSFQKTRNDNNQFILNSADKFLTNLCKGM